MNDPFEDILTAIETENRHQVERLLSINPGVVRGGIKEGIKSVRYFFAWRQHKIMKEIPLSSALNAKLDDVYARCHYGP